jgi:hypothetical protein
MKGEGMLPTSDFAEEGLLYFSLNIFECLSKINLNLVQSFILQLFV